MDSEMGGVGGDPAAGSGQPEATSAASASPAASPAGRVVVRLAQSEADIAAMMALGRQLHAESRFRSPPLDDARMAEIGRRGLEGAILA